MSHTCGQEQQQRDRQVIRCRNGRAGDHRGVAGMIETDKTVETAAPGHGPKLVQKARKFGHATGLQLVLSPTGAIFELSGEQKPNLLFW
jgi:hypothetical protein